MLPDVFRKLGFARPRTHNGNLELTAVLTLLMVAIYGYFILSGNLYFGTMVTSAIPNTVILKIVF